MKIIRITEISIRFLSAFFCKVRLMYFFESKLQGLISAGIHPEEETSRKHANKKLQVTNIGAKLFI